MLVYCCCVAAAVVAAVVSSESFFYMLFFVFFFFLFRLTARYFCPSSLSPNCLLDGWIAGWVGCFKPY